MNLKPSLFLALALLPAFSIQAQQPKESDTPSIADTVTYINNNIDDTVTLSGTSLTVKSHIWEITMDVMNLGDAFQDPDRSDHIFMGCKGNGNRCMDWSYIGNKTGIDDKTTTYVTMGANDASIAPHVANAFRHLIRLLQQQSLSSQPF